MNYRLLTDFEKGWISALIDGEGCLSIPRRGRGLQVIVTNTNLCLLAAAKNLLGGVISEVNTNRNSFNKKACFKLQVGISDWKSWLPQITLIEKEGKRQEFLAYLIRRMKR